MIDRGTLLTYLATLTAFMVIPGPAVLLTLARSMSGGRRVGLATALGISAGDLGHTALAVFGLSAVLAASLLIFNLIKYAGAAYLVYLGIRAFIERTDALPDGGAAPIGVGRAFRQAALTEILNPKSAMFFLAFLPQFVRPENGALAPQLAMLGALFVLVGTASTVIFALAAGSIGNALKHSAAAGRWRGRVLGSIYCGLGLRLALEER
jgi:threonine/homoserine/homoserine lactone efflux protein